MATTVLIQATIIQVAYSWFKHKEVKPMQWITLGLVVVMGGATILLHDERFLKWKLSIVEWSIGLAFLVTQFVGSKTLIERTPLAELNLPSLVIRRLNLVWASFFIGVGFLNVYVMYNFTTEEWVNFKLFGVTGLMFVFMLVQIIFLYKYIPETKEK